MEPSESNADMSITIFEKGFKFKSPFSKADCLRIFQNPQKYGELTKREITFAKTLGIDLEDLEGLDCNIYSSYNEAKNCVSFRVSKRLRGGGCGFGFSSMKKAIYCEFSDKAPSWRTIESGINFEGVCKNDQCQAYQKSVLSPKKFGMFSVGKLKVSCPQCMKEITPTRCGFYDCYYEFEGELEDGKKEKGEAQAPRDKYMTFEADDISTWKSLDILVKRYKRDVYVSFIFKRTSSRTFIVEYSDQNIAELIEKIENFEYHLNYDSYHKELKCSVYEIPYSQSGFYAQPVYKSCSIQVVPNLNFKSEIRDIKMKDEKNNALIIEIDFEKMIADDVKELESTLASKIQRMLDDSSLKFNFL